MTSLSILIQSNPSEQWKSWLRALAEEKFEIEEINSNPVDFSAFTALRSRAILLDGLLPYFPQIITCLRSLHPAMHIIVASEENSFTIYYRLWRLGGSAYLPGPMPPDQFVSKIRSIIQ